MKKIAIAILFLTVAFAINSCKKKECPKPEVWAPGKWKATEWYDHGVLQDPSDPEVACYLQTNFIFGADGLGKLRRFVYNPGTCEMFTIDFDWAENLDKKFLYIKIDRGPFIEFTYENKNKFYLLDDQQQKYVFERQ